jgi:hypothetical protein
MDAADEVQTADEVTSLVDPSLYFAAAENCWLWFTASDAVPVIESDVTVGTVDPDVLRGEVFPHPSRPPKKIASTHPKSKPDTENVNLDPFNRFNLHLRARMDIALQSPTNTTIPRTVTQTHLPFGRYSGIACEPASGERTM